MVRFVNASRAVIVSKSYNAILFCSANGKKWHLPGGWVDEFEDLKSTCAREAFEELGVKVNVKDLLFCSEYTILKKNNPYKEDVHKFEYVFSCSLIDEESYILNSKTFENPWVDQDNERIKFVRWFTLEDISENSRNIYNSSIFTRNIISFTSVQKFIESGGQTYYNLQKIWEID